MRWPKTKRNHCFEVLFSLILCNNNEPFLDWIVMCDEKWILYDNQHRPAQWLDREEVPKHFLKPNLHQKRSWSLFGGLLPIWSNTAFWILTKPLHLKTMLSKSMRCTQNCNACPALINRKSLIHLHNTAQSPVAQPTVQKLNKLDYKDLPHPLYSPDLSPTDHHFCEENASTDSRMQNMLSKSSLNPEARIFTLQE